MPSWYISKSSPVPNLAFASSIKSTPLEVLSISIFVAPVVLPIASISDKLSAVSIWAST